jgi:hypothetical protein
MAPFWWIILWKTSRRNVLRLSWTCTYVFNEHMMDDVQYYTFVWWVRRLFTNYQCISRSRSRSTCNYMYKEYPNIRKSYTKRVWRYQRGNRKLNGRSLSWHVKTTHLQHKLYSEFLIDICLLGFTKTIFSPFLSMVGWLVYGVKRHFQQYFSYIKDLYL